MKPMIQLKQVNKNYGRVRALQDVTLNLEPGKVVGLIGLNGAGKTTLLKILLGLSSCRGDIEILGMHPYHQRKKLMEQIAYIADVAILPRWLKAQQAIDFVAGVHPRFNRQKALNFLKKTNIPLQKKIKTFSKGMIVQLHLALIMAIEAELLILDEPTLGLDVLRRKDFYRTLLNDYFNKNRSVIISTHQIEEVETLLTHVLMINQGVIILDCSIETFAQRFVAVTAPLKNKPALDALQPLSQQKHLDQIKYVFENVDKNKLAAWGSVFVPPISDVFVAKVGGTRV